MLGRADGWSFMCEANPCLPVHQDSSGKQAPARLTPCCCMECTRLEHVVVVACSRAATFPSPTARLASATCLKSIDGRLGIDQSHPIHRRIASSLCTLRLKSVPYFDLSSSHGPLAYPSLRQVGVREIMAFESCSSSVPHLPFSLPPFHGICVPTRDTSMGTCPWPLVRLMCARLIRMYVHIYAISNAIRFTTMSCHVFKTRTRRRATSTARIRSVCTGVQVDSCRFYRPANVDPDTSIKACTSGPASRAAGPSSPRRIVGSRRVATSGWRSGAPLLPYRVHTTSTVSAPAPYPPADAQHST